jgi:hypothetical protein
MKRGIEQSPLFNLDKLQGIWIFITGARKSECYNPAIISQGEGQ